MLIIKNVSAVLDETDLLKNITIEVNSGEIHAIMGPKRTGKSSLGHLITGHPSIVQTEGSITFNKKNISRLDCDDRASMGISITFQNPPEMPGLKNYDLAKLILKSKKDKRSDHEIEEAYKALCKSLKLDDDHGGQSMDYDDMTTTDFRKNELLLLLLINPKLAIIDEVDTDMDDDDLALVGESIKRFSNKKNSIIVITHNQKLLDMVVPSHVHILVNGEIKEHGDTQLYKRIIEDDYSQFS